MAGFARQGMSKTAAIAVVSTQCGFTNGAGRTVTVVKEKKEIMLDKQKGKEYNTEHKT